MHLLATLKYFQMGRFGDFTREKSTPTKATRCTEIVIPRRNLEISDEAWDKTIEKAATMTIIQENSKSLVNKTREPVINKELLQYLQQLSLKNQELLSSTQKTIDLFQQKLKIQEEEESALKQKVLELKEKELKVLELKEKELKEKELKEKELKEKELKEKEIKEQALKKEKETKEKQVVLKPEQVTVPLANEQSKQNDLHSIPGRVVSVSAYEDAQSCLQVITNAKKLKHALNSPSIFKGKMTIRTRCGQFMNLQSKVIEIVFKIYNIY